MPKVPVFKFLILLKAFSVPRREATEFHITSYRTLSLIKHQIVCRLASCLAIKSRNLKEWTREKFHLDAVETAGKGPRAQKGRPAEKNPDAVQGQRGGWRDCKEED